MEVARNFIGSRTASLWVSTNSRLYQLIQNLVPWEIVGLPGRCGGRWGEKANHRENHLWWQPGVGEMAALESGAL